MGLDTHWAKSKNEFLAPVLGNRLCKTEMMSDSYVSLSIIDKCCLTTKSYLREAPQSQRWTKHLLSVGILDIPCFAMGVTCRAKEEDA